MRKSAEALLGVTRKGLRGRAATLLGLLPVAACGALVTALPVVLTAQRAAALVFDPPVLMLVLNTLLLFGVSLVVLAVASRAYLATGAFSLLLLGSGALFLGSGALVGGWVKPLGGSANASVTVHNLGVLIAAALHSAGAVTTLLRTQPEQDPRRRRWKLRAAVTATLAVIVAYSAASVGGHLPPFWSAETGSTVLKQAVLVTAEVLFVLSAVHMMVLHLRAGPSFLYWYSLALVLMAVGLEAITLMKAVGDPIGWAGRLAQYVGGAYLLVAALEALSKGRTTGAVLESAIERFYRFSNVHYRDLVESVGEAILSIDHSRRVLLWNRGAERMLGHSRAEATGRIVTELLTPPDQSGRLEQELDDLVGQLHDETVFREVEIHIRRKDGSVVPSQTSISLRRMDAGWTATLVVRDITERKASETERAITSGFLALANTAPGARELIREAARFFQTHTGCSAVGVCLKRGEAYPYREALGFPREPRPGGSALCHRGGAESGGGSERGCLCSRVIGGQSPPAGCSFTRYGSFWTNSAAQLLASQAGNGVGAHCGDGCFDAGFASVALLPLVAGNLRLGLLHLGDHRGGLFSPASIALWEHLAGHLAVALAKALAEEELRTLNERLERQVAERTATAESRARELQELAVQLIEAEERERRRIAELLHDDLQQILAGARLQLQAARATLPPQPLLSGVDKLLGESIAKSRRLSHDLSPAVLHHAGLRLALEWLARQMKEQHGLEVVFEADATGPDNQEDEEPLRAFLYRSVRELLFNVVKHAQAGKAHVRLERSDEQLRVSVSDAGRGMNAETLKPAEGFRAGVPLPGFGLLTMRERVQAVGGHLVIQSEPGLGTRITLSVPRARLMMGAATSGRQQAAGGGESPAPGWPERAGAGHLFRVLLVDDHKVMRQGLIAMISGRPDIQVVGEASNGAEAVELARELRPDVIVMDVAMPKMDGVEATRRIKEEMPEVHVIGLSMLDEEEITPMMRAAGAEAFVSKAESAGSLLRAIYGLTGRPVESGSNGLAPSGLSGP